MATDRGGPRHRLSAYVTFEPNATRLLVARRIGAERISDPLHGPDPGGVIEAANIAYLQVVDERVQKALSIQVELERSFLTLDADLARNQISMAEAIDQTIVRALTAGLGIGVAAFTAKEVRGWPTAVAALVVGIYVAFTAISQLKGFRSIAHDRLDMFEQLANARGFGLAEKNLQTRLDVWRKSISQKVRHARIALLILAAIISILGAVGAASVMRRQTARGEPVPPYECSLRRLLPSVRISAVAGCKKGRHLGDCTGILSQQKGPRTGVHQVAASKVEARRA